MKFTQEYIREIFFYDEETGKLYWNYNSNKPSTWNTRFANTEAGCFDGKYIRLGIDGIKCLAHRIIWLYLYGVYPPRIDHRDGDGSNNKQDNLRISTQSQNIANASFGKYRGIEAHGTKYRARICVDRNRIELGSFNTLEEANQAYETAADKYFGEFAEYNR